MKQFSILLWILALMVVLSTLFTAITVANVKTDLIMLSDDVAELTERVDSLETRISILEVKYID